MHPQTRWQQRFSNFKKSFSLLKEISNIAFPSEAEELGLIKSFEICFELAWKTLKDYLNYQGQTLNSPREIIKQAAQNLLIEDAEVWLEALMSRNEMTHIYDEKIADKVSEAIKDEYLEILSEFHKSFLKLEDIN